MKRLGQRYVQYINRTYKRSGTLWEGRFRSCIVQQEEYLFTCQRYIEMNPVCAQMVKNPGEYRWSSHRSNGLGACPRIDNLFKIEAFSKNEHSHIFDITSIVF